MSRIIKDKNNVKENIKNIIGLKYAPKWQLLKELGLFVKYLEHFDHNKILIKSLGELEDEIKPSDLRHFEKGLYLLARHNLIMVKGSRALFITVKGTSSLDPELSRIFPGKSWKGILKKFAKEPTSKSLGEILLHYLYSTRSDSLRSRRRKAFLNILKFYITPIRLQKLSEILKPIGV